MKSSTLDLRYERRVLGDAVHSARPRLAATLNRALAGFLPVLALPLIAAWAVSAGATEYLAASWWAVGFLFFALAIEAERHPGLLAATGTVLIILAWLSSRLAPEFAVIGAPLVAVWLVRPMASLMNWAGRSGGR